MKIKSPSPYDEVQDKIFKTVEIATEIQIVLIVIMANAYRTLHHQNNHTCSRFEPYGS